MPRFSREETSVFTDPGIEWRGPYSDAAGAEFMFADAVAPTYLRGVPTFGSGEPALFDSDKRRCYRWPRAPLPVELLPVNFEERFLP